MSRVSASPVASPPSGDLARLLETEQRLEARLTEARAEAEALVTRARADAAAREATVETELRAEERRLDEAFETERGRREGEIAAAAQRDVETYQRVPAARLAAVARALVERFLVGEGAA